MVQVFGRGNRDILIEALNWSTTNVTSSTTTSTTKQQGDLSLVQLRSMLAPFVLRRLKRDVLDQLTDKTIVVQRLVMPTAQQSVYDNILLGHATRKEVLKVRKQTEEKAQLVLEDRVRNRVSSNTALNTTSTTASASNASSSMTTPVVPMIDLTSPAKVSGSSGSSSTAEADVCVSPFNKKQHRTVKLISSDILPSEAFLAVENTSIHSSHSSSNSISNSISNSSKGGLAPLGPVFPSEIDLAAIANESINSADIDPLSAAAVDDQIASTVIQQLSSSEANHLFTALRKAANHPLLLRVRYKDEKVMEKIAMISHSMGHFGNQCDYQRVRDEVIDSDCFMRCFILYIYTVNVCTAYIYVIYIYVFLFFADTNTTLPTPTTTRTRSTA